MRCASPSCGKTIERTLIQGSHTDFRNMGDRDEAVEVERFTVCSWRCLANAATACAEHEEEHRDHEPF